jgi:hypothetical protein
VVAVTLGLVDDTPLVSYWFTPMISCSGVDYLAVALLCSGSRDDEPYLIYGDDDHLVGVGCGIEFCY